MVSQNEIPLIDEILSSRQKIIGEDYQGYRNHVLRMTLFCFSLRECTDEEKRKISIAACFHDIGLWTKKTVDYIEPSIAAAQEYLESNNLLHWSQEITLMISEHHKLTESKNNQFPLIELFRKSDLVDVSLGFVKFGLSSDYVKSIKIQYPNAGFHKNLGKLAALWFIRHPWNPAPMMKW